MATTKTSFDLGGPSSPCSVNRVRRLRAGELTGDEKSRTASHLLACEKCRAADRELEAEQEALLEQLPFDAFAAGVAEKLAVSAPAKKRFPAWIPAAAAACLLLGIGVPFGLSRQGSGEAADGNRTKGGSFAQLYVKDAAGLHDWQAGQKIPEDADVHAELKAEAGPFAAVVLQEGNEVHPLFSGIARQPDGKPRVVSFGWTGTHGATLYIARGRRHLEVDQLAAAVRASPGAPTMPDAEIDVVRLSR